MNDSGKKYNPSYAGNRSDLFHFPAADALNADFHPLVSSVVIHIDGLDVGFENAGGYLHNVHTDSAFFLRKTPADDSRALNFLLSANFTDIAHSDTSIIKLCISIDVIPKAE